MPRNGSIAASLLGDSNWRLLRADNWRRWTTVVSAIVALWLERGRSRRVLATLDDHQLRDIGVTRDEARIESAKPFWQP